MRPLPSSSLIPGLFIFIQFISSANSLYSLPNSPCASQCGNVLSSTTGGDIVCADSDYPSTTWNSGTVVGTTYQNCLSCQISSKYVDPTTQQTDLEWALYNLRYAVSSCLFGYGNDTDAVTDNPCVTRTACGSLEPAFEFNNLSLSADGYGYCQDWYAVQIPTCQSCVSLLSSAFYLTNFITALNAACEQQPTAGSTISIQGSLFSTKVVNITAPTSVASGTSSGSSSGINLDQRVGIAVGAVVVLLIIAGCTIICVGKRRRRKTIAMRQLESGYWAGKQQFGPGNGGLGGNIRISTDLTRPTPPGEFFDSPDSQVPLNSRDWGNPRRGSPASDKRFFSPYSSQLTSPVNGNDAVPVRNREWPYPVDPPTANEYPLDRKSSVGSVAKKGPEETAGERIEMHDVRPAPVFYYSGHQRSGSNPLTEEDYKQGRAV